MAGFSDIIIETGSAVQAAKQNARQAKAEAEMLEAEGMAAESSSRTRSKIAQAEARAQIGASGAGIEGSPLEILIENAKQAELEALNIRYSKQARVAARKQEAKFAKKTILPIILGGVAKGGARAAGIASKGASGGAGGGGGGGQI